ncbi:MAG: DMT family transporter [Oligoflexia bacterium]|nr:DMT family transporter [Oligoflexia bacterium]
MNQLLVHVALISVSTLYSIAYLVNKFVMDRLHPAAVVYIRVLGAAAILTVILFPKIRRHFPTRSQWLQITTMSILGIVLNLILFMEGLARTSATHGALISSTIPIVVLSFASFLGYEKLNPRRIAGIALSMAGVWMTFWASKTGSGEAKLWGDFLCVLNTLCFSLYLTLSLKINRSVPPMIVTWGMMVAGTVLLIPYSYSEFVSIPWTSLTWVDHGAFAYIVLGSTVATYFLNNWALSKAESSFVGLYILLQPLITSILDRIFRGQILTGLSVWALVLIILGVVIGQTSKRNKNGSLH